MSGLDDIAYSRDATVAAVRDYYAFLTDMYLDEAEVLEPPTTGWPSIDNLQCMGKTPEVLDLLRHLPYIRREENDGLQAFPGCCFADWRELAQRAGDDGHGLRVCSEPVELVDRIPPHVIGLTYGGRNNSTFLLDTKYGIVHWYECGDAVRYNMQDSPDPEWERAVTDVDDPFDWEDVPEEEAEWRAEHPAWSVEEFFEILKRRFRDLTYVPLSAQAVYSTREDEGAEDFGEMLPALQDIYRSYGWPDLEVFDKEACSREIRRVVKRGYPDHEFLFGEEEDEEENDEE